MMQRLTAFEFIAAHDGPQLVRLRRVTGELLAQFTFVNWVGVDLETMLGGGIAFALREEFVIDGEGLGHPYWNGDTPSWLRAFDSRGEAQRLAVIRAAVQREVNRAQIALVPQ